MTPSSLNKQLLKFLQQSPTPFHATQSCATLLTNAGFTQLHEADDWQLKPGKGYFVTRNDSSLIAFRAAKNLDAPFQMVGAHTDSPCLKVKPSADLTQKGYYQIAVEVYGGALLYPWFDRDLSLAGRVNFLDEKGALEQRLIDFKKPIGIIPSLAIHLDRDANAGRQINKQKEVNPLLLQLGKNESIDFFDILKTQLLAEHPDSQPSQILDFEISCYDTQAPCLVGLREEFIAGSRLDNLLSCYVAIQSLLDAAPKHHALVCLNDHEEVGSSSYCGADGPFLQQVIERVIPDTTTRNRALARSQLISADNAHGIHPNFTDKHDENHAPLLNHGPVIKINHNQRYASTSETSASFRALCAELSIPVQTFASNNSLACGSTIGPITSSQIGIRTLDIGVATFSMHSIRELAGSDDPFYLYQALCAVLSAEG